MLLSGLWTQKPRVPHCLVSQVAVLDEHRVPRLDALFKGGPARRRSAHKGLACGGPTDVFWGRDT